MQFGGISVQVKEIENNVKNDTEIRQLTVKSVTFVLFCTFAFLS